METPHHWTEKQEKLLRSWAERAAGYRWLHNHARLHNKKINDYLSYPSIIIASITGVGGFAVLNPNGNDGMSEETKLNILILQYIFAFLNVVGGVLTSVSKFSQTGSLAQAHSDMCILYSKYYRNIDMELSLDVADRTSVVEFVKKCREDYDRLLDEAPDIPAESIQAFNLEFPDKRNKPDVCNGLSIIICDETSSQTTKVVSKWLAGITGVGKRRTSRDGDIDELARMESA